MTGPRAAVPPSTQPGAQGWQPLYLLAGVGALLFVVLLVTALVLDSLSPPPVHGGEATLLCILVAGAAMSSGRRKAFPRFLAWLGIVTGVLGVLSEVLRQALPEFYWGYGILLWAWFAATGIALVRLSRSAP